MKNLCIIQARMSATRLPNKVLKKVGQATLLGYQIKRLKLSKKIDKIVIATTISKQDNKIENFCRKNKINYFRGDENDVLDRYYQCSLKYPQYKNIIRLTGDCPLIDPKIIDSVINFFEENKFDYAANVNPKLETFPDGLDVEIFKKSVLERAWQKAKLNSEREHVTPYIIKSKQFKKGTLTAPYDFSHFRLTVDELQDFEVIKFIIQHSKITDGYLKYISLLTKNPHIMLKNMHITRNEGLLKSVKNDFKA